MDVLLYPLRSSRAILLEVLRTLNKMKRHGWARMQRVFFFNLSLCTSVSQCRSLLGTLSRSPCLDTWYAHTMKVSRWNEYPEYREEPKTNTKHLLGADPNCESAPFLWPSRACNLAKRVARGSVSGLPQDYLAPASFRVQRAQTTG